MEKTTKSKLSKWLEILQQESWQLELIISGFAIFLILGIYEPLQDLRFKINLLSASEGSYGLLRLPHTLLQWVWFALIINLTTHVLFRGLWISTVGLRYVSGDVDFEELKLKSPFNEFLQRRIISFDHYIERLEKICSVIFSFTFLIIFIIISLGLFFFSLLSFYYLLSLLPKSFMMVTSMVQVLVTIIVLLGGLIYFIDFLTLGWLKRSKWFAPIYFPFYRLLGWMTFASVYRPIYYNLIDNKFGRWLGYFLVPYIVLIAIAISIKIETHGFIPNRSDAYNLNHYYYDDQRDSRSASNAASIPSKFVENGYLELFMPLNPRRDDRAIGVLCPGLRPAKKTGFRVGNIGSAFSKPFESSPLDSISDCLNQFHQIYIDDSLYTETKFLFYEHPIRKKKGLLTILDINHLDRGEHYIKSMTYTFEERVKQDTIYLEESSYFPFWKE